MTCGVSQPAYSDASNHIKDVFFFFLSHDRLCKDCNKQGSGLYSGCKVITQVISRVRFFITNDPNKQTDIHMFIPLHTLCFRVFNWYFKVSEYCMFDRQYVTMIPPGPDSEINNIDSIFKV